MNAHTQRNYARSDARVDDFGLSFAALCRAVTKPATGAPALC